jgi:hypothetical protein
MTEEAPKQWPAPGSVWLRLNVRGEVETVWLHEPPPAPEDQDAPYTVERWAVHNEDGKPI